MKQRIIVAVIGIPLLLAILCVAPDWATAALLAALSVVGTHELLAAVCGPEKTRRWTALPAVMGILVVLHFYGAGHGWQLPLGIVDGLLLVGVIALPAAGVLTYGKPHALTLLDVCVMALAGLAIPASFSCLLLLRMLPHGGGLVLVPLVAAFCSDSAALFTGMACGKHKLSPLVSPHKTVEGAVGGLVGGMLGMVIFRIIFYLCTLQPLHIGGCILMGLVGALMGQLGDLSFSVIKRQYGIIQRIVVFPVFRLVCGADQQDAVGEVVGVQRTEVGFGVVSGVDQIVFVEARCRGLFLARAKRNCNECVCEVT